MKLCTTALVPFFCALTLATITLEDIPSELRSGSDHYIKWTQDHDYVSARHPSINKHSSAQPTSTILTSLSNIKRIQAFYLLHKPSIQSNFGFEQHVLQATNYTAGSQDLKWKVPAVKDNGYVSYEL